MHNEKEDNQALKLQQLFSEVNNQDIDKKEEKEKQKEQALIEIDVLNLPPRSEVHQKTSVRFQMDVRSPIWRFLIVILLVLGGIGVVYYFFGDQMIMFFS